jgi:adenosylcobinamide-GDP ribazoletransferase
MKLFYGFALAFNMLTILPFFKVHTFFKGINGYSAMFYPLVGFIIGTILWGVHTLLQDFLPAVHAAVIIFALWVLFTGALHLDGFSDTIDGLFVPKERALEVMKDAHVGGMGMIFTFVFLALKLSSLIYFDAFYLLPVLLMTSRLNATLAIWFFPYASHGVGALLKEELSLKMVLFALFYTLLMSLLFSFTFAFLLSLAVLFICALLFTKRLGGLSGDVYGFIIELTELVLLNYLIVRAYS